MKIVALRLENQQPRELSANKAAPIKPSSRLRFLTIREACMGGLTKVTCAGDRSELSIAETVCRARREFGGLNAFRIASSAAAVHRTGWPALRGRDRNLRSTSRELCCTLVDRILSR